MNICLFTDSFLPRIGGMEWVIHHIANALNDKGCKTTVIAKKSKQPTNHLDLKQTYEVIYYGYTFPLSWRIKADFLSGLRVLVREHNKRRFDVINCHGVSYAGMIAAWAKRIIKVPLVMTPHGKDIQKIPEIGYGLRLNRKWDRIIMRNLGAADAVTAISDAVRSELTEVKAKICTIPNGIDIRHFIGPKSDFLHSRLALDPNVKILLSVGRNHTKKGYKYGFFSLKHLIDDGMQEPIVYVVIGKNTKNLAPIVRSLSLEKHVHLLPEMDRPSIIASYLSSWCFFSPSIVEGLPLVSIEAMAAGLPLIVTNVPGNRDIIRDNRCGILVKDRDPKSMAMGIARLYRNGALYRKLSKAAIEGAKRYDWMKIANKYLKIYRQSAGISEPW